MRLFHCTQVGDDAGRQQNVSGQLLEQEIQVIRRVAPIVLLPAEAADEFLGALHLLAALIDAVLQVLFLLRHGGKVVVQALEFV